jgi:hypothetical protein
MRRREGRTVIDDTLANLLRRPGDRDVSSAAGPAESAGVPGEPAMLELLLLDGGRLALPYRTLYSVGLNPSRGIVATFATHTVTIAGVHLLSVYDSLINQTTSHLEAVGNRPKRLIEGVAVIFSITAEERT